MAQSYAQKIVAGVIRLYPSYVTEPLDVQWNHGNAAVLVLDADGTLAGHVFGPDKAVGQQCIKVGMRKLLQVWRTGYLTGRFEELVFAGKLDEDKFGVQRPDFIGWEGGVPLLAPDGTMIAAAFSGFRGFRDIEIIERAGAELGLKVKRD